MRPAEGNLSTEEIATLVELTHERGGMHGTYDRAGEPFPYELNISFPDLFGGVDDPLMADRIILLHTIVLALAGVPAIYVNSLMGTTNNYAGVEADGVRRTINRGRIQLDDVPSIAGDSWQSRIYRGLIERATLRRQHGAFHPEGAQTLQDLDGVLAIHRSAPRGSHAGESNVSVYCNMTNEPRAIPLDHRATCLLTGASIEGELTLDPYASAWLVPR